MDEHDHLTRSFEWESALAKWKNQVDRSNDATNRSVSFGLAAVKGVIFINGAAAVSLLAFIANTLGNGVLKVHFAENILSNMKLFVVGVALGVTAYGIAYFSEAFTSVACSPGNEEHWSQRASMLLAWIAIFLFAASLFLFVYGVWGVSADLLEAVKSSVKT